jgi:hypothetical protein
MLTCIWLRIALDTAGAFPESSLFDDSPPAIIDDDNAHKARARSNQLCPHPRLCHPCFSAAPP